MHVDTNTVAHTTNDEEVSAFVLVPAGSSGTQRIKKLIELISSTSPSLQMSWPSKLEVFFRSRITGDVYILVDGDPYS